MRRQPWGGRVGYQVGEGPRGSPRPESHPNHQGSARVQGCESNLCASGPQVRVLPAGGCMQRPNGEDGQSRRPLGRRLWACLKPGLDPVAPDAGSIAGARGDEDLWTIRGPTVSPGKPRLVGPCNHAPSPGRGRASAEA